MTQTEVYIRQQVDRQIAMEKAGLPVESCLVDHGEQTIQRLLTPETIRQLSKNDQIALLCIVILRQ